MMGTVQIMTEPDCIDFNAYIQATPNYGYHFTQWSDGNTSNPRTITLTRDTSFTAHFDYNQYTITGTSTDTTMGSVSGSATQNYLTLDTLTATANYGYHFTQWDDGDTNNPRVVLVDSNRTYIAQFSANQYQVTVISDDSIAGTVGAGARVDYLDTLTVTATANMGYHFTTWNDGETTNPRTLQVTCDTTLVAYFDRNTYTVTLATNDARQGTVTGGGTYLYGDTATIAASPAAHHHLVTWSDGNADTVRTLVIAQDINLTATFGIDTLYVNIEANDIARGNVTGSGEYPYGSVVEATAAAYTGYRFAGWDNGVTATPYTFAALTDTTITAIFEEETEGIAPANSTPYTIHTTADCIVVEGITDETVRLYDMTGRCLQTLRATKQCTLQVPTAGVYLLQVGDSPAQKVVVVR